MDTEITNPEAEVENPMDIIEGYGEMEPWEDEDSVSSENKTNGETTEDDVETQDEPEKEDKDTTEDKDATEDKSTHEVNSDSEVKKAEKEPESEPKIVYREDPAKAKELASVTARLAEMENALRAYGFKENSEDLIDSIWAESKAISLEEYRKQKSAEAPKSEEKVKPASDAGDELSAVKAEQEKLNQELKKAQFEIVMASDLSILKTSHPELTAGSIKELPNSKAFMALRAYGYNAEEAYAMANYKQTAEKAKAAGEAAARKQASKDHMKGFSDRSGTSGDELPEIPESEMYFWREAYPDLKKSELKAKYAKAQKIIGENK